MDKRETIISLWNKLQRGTKGKVRRQLCDAINKMEGEQVITYGSAKSHWFADNYEVNKKYQDFTIKFFTKEIKRQSNGAIT